VTRWTVGITVDEVGVGKLSEDAQMRETAVYAPARKVPELEPTARYKDAEVSCTICTGQKVE
jgi:hypothetical protein